MGCSHQVQDQDEITKRVVILLNYVIVNTSHIRVNAQQQFIFLQLCKS